MATSAFEEVGPPDFMIAGLRVWVFGRQYGDSQDFWDGNWVNVLVHCAAGGAQVETSGPILHLSSLAQWLDQTRELHRTLNGSAELGSIEPNLSAKIALEDGHGSLVVDITPDHLTQQHRFIFEVDQSYLPELIGGLVSVLSHYPLRGRR